jgi:hypothetical protein
MRESELAHLPSLRSLPSSVGWWNEDEIETWWKLTRVKTLGELQLLLVRMTVKLCAQFWAGSNFMTRIFTRLTGNIQSTLINFHASLVLVWLGHCIDWDTVLTETLYWLGHCIDWDTVLTGTLYWLRHCIDWGHCIDWDTVLTGTLYWLGHCIDWDTVLTETLLSAVYSVNNLCKRSLGLR